MATVVIIIGIGIGTWLGVRKLRRERTAQQQPKE